MTPKSIHTEAPYKYDIFLSHHAEEKTFSQRLSQSLQALDFGVWPEQADQDEDTYSEEKSVEALWNSSVCILLFGPGGQPPWPNTQTKSAIKDRLQRSHGVFRVIQVLLPGTPSEISDSLPQFRRKELFLDGPCRFIRFKETIDEKNALNDLILMIRGANENCSSIWRFGKNRELIRQRAKNYLNVNWLQLEDNIFGDSNVIGLNYIESLKNYNSQGKKKENFWHRRTKKTCTSTYEHLEKLFRTMIEVYQKTGDYVVAIGDDDEAHQRMRKKSLINMVKVGLDKVQLTSGDRYVSNSEQSNSKESSITESLVWKYAKHLISSKLMFEEKAIQPWSPLLYDLQASSSKGKCVNSFLQLMGCSRSSSIFWCPYEHATALLPTRRNKFLEHKNNLKGLGAVNREDRLNWSDDRLPYQRLLSFDLRYAPMIFILDREQVMDRQQPKMNNPQCRHMSTIGPSIRLEGFLMLPQVLPKQFTQNLLFYKKGTETGWKLAKSRDPWLGISYHENGLPDSEWIEAPNGKVEIECEGQPFTIKHHTFFHVVMPMALVTGEEEIAFSNLAFQQKFGLMSGQQPVREVASLFSRSIRQVEIEDEKQGEPDTVSHELDRATRFHLTYLNGIGLTQHGLWLLTMTGSEDVKDPIHHFMKTKNLSRRESEVAQFIRAGFLDKEIAQKLCISSFTVNQHIKSIHKKLGTHTRSHLVSLLNEFGRIQKSWLP